jgi:hypothetical protein
MISVIAARPLHPRKFTLFLIALLQTISVQTELKSAS